MENLRYFECECGNGGYIHLGKGVFACPKCGREIIVGNAEDWSEEGDDDFGYTWDELWGDKPEVCQTCNEGAYPDCRRLCSKIPD